MKINKILSIFILLSLAIMIGCSNDIKNNENKIVVKKQVNKTDKYEFYKEIEDSERIKNINEILNDINWENAMVNMVRPADYLFHFKNTKEIEKSNELIYALWISPSNEKIELLIDSEVKYAQLDKEKSEELFELLTEKNLSDTK